MSRIIWNLVGTSIFSHRNLSIQYKKVVFEWVLIAYSIKIIRWPQQVLFFRQIIDQFRDELGIGPRLEGRHPVLSLDDCARVFLEELEDVVA